VDSSLLTARGALLRGGDGWCRFLSRVGKDAGGEHRFSARNFLLDEGIVSPRVDSYAELAAMAEHGSVEDWLGAHGAYLAERVFRQPSGDGLPMSLDPADEISCPETFRFIDPASPFLTTDPRAHLIRIERLDFVADFAGIARDELRRLAEAVVGPEEPKPVRKLNDVLAAWARNIEARPVFAAFLEDVLDLFADGSSDWADTLRDSLGLLHFDPSASGAAGARGLDILVFLYRVSEVSRLLGGARDYRPLVPPTVLDGRPSPAFLPAPAGSLTGHAVDLSAAAKHPRREVLHPSIPFQAKHLWKVGTIRRPAEPENLAEARGVHLWLVRGVSGRGDYALGTDGDLK